jgi:hypothetical protein
MKTRRAKKTVYAVAYKDGSVSSKMFDTEDEAQAFIASLSPSKKREVHSIFARDVKRSDHTEGERERRERHTPTPWKYTDALGLFDLHGNHITDIKSYGMFPVMNQLNAAFIVRAVNSFDPMLGALEAVFRYADMPLDIQDMVKEAIAIATEREANEIAQDEGKEN